MTRQTLVKSLLVIFLALPLLGSSTRSRPPESVAQGSEGPDTPRVGESEVQAAGVGVPDATDEEFVADSGGYLDQYLFREDVPGGRLTFAVEIDRYYSDHMAFDGDGFLTNHQQLVEKGLLPEKALLRLRVWDVDHDSSYDGDGDGIPDPEVDHVYVNAHLLVDSQGQPKKLASGGSTWSVWSAEIPIEWLKFPQNPGSSTQHPDSAQNEIAIDIDTTTPGYWAVECDWGSLRIEPDLRPTVLVHGFTGTRDAWRFWYTYPDGQPGDFMYEEWVPTEVVQLGLTDSMDGNADMLAGQIAAFKSKYGVDKVYIVGHSKGGLDARAYLRSHNDVEVLVQLGTPNGGALLADYVLGARILPTKLMLPANIVGLLLDPALTQISTPYMTLFNLFTGKNPNTKYVVYAGNHDPAGWVQGVPWLPGEDDTLVRVSSAHALSWFDFQEKFTRDEPNMDATHTGLHNSYDVFRLVLNQLRNADTLGAGETLSQAQQAEESLDRTVTLVGEIYTGQTVTETVVVDQADDMALQVVWGEGDVDMVVYTPSGTRVDPGLAASRTDIDYMESKHLRGFAHVAYVFHQTESGIWTAEISGIDVGSGKVYFLAAFLKGAGITLTANTDKESYNTGDTVKVSAQLLENSQAVTGAAVTAHVEAPDHGLEEVTLYDDGAHGDGAAQDGAYAGSYAGATLEGYYDILVEASGATVSSGDFTRSRSLVVPVAEGVSSLDPGHSDYALDEDGDGLYNTLYIDVGLNIARAGTYRVAGVLVDSQDNEIQSDEASGSLSVGAQSLTLGFDGNLIFRSGVNGPYYLKGLYLAKHDDALLPFDSQDVAHATSAYDFASFQRPPIALTGSNSDWPQDVDGDGVYDLLNVDMEVAVTQDGYYDLNAQLVDGNGDLIVWATLPNAYLSHVSSVRLQFPGEPIGDHGVDGSYDVRDLSIVKTDGSVGEVYGVVHTTQAYDASDFKGHFAYIPLVMKAPLRHNTGPIGRITLNLGDSYDFSDGVFGRYSGGDLYLSTGLKFYANNTGQRGVTSLGDIGSTPLEYVAIPATGYTRFGIPAVLEHTYVLLAQEGQEGSHIIFRVHAIGGNSVVVNHVYVSG